MNSEHNSEPVEMGEKVVIIGDTSVGKTSVILRYINNTFSDSVKPTIGCEHYEKEIDLEDDKKIKLSIWDTAGQERFRGLAGSYYKKAKAILLVYDITKKSSFDKLDFWRDEIANFAPEDILVVLIGNKTDLKEQREVTPDDADAYVKKHNYHYLETSAVDNSDENIQKVFAYIGKNIFEKKGQSEKTIKNSGVKKSGAEEIDINKKDDKAEGGCKC